MKYIPVTKEQNEEMLKKIGVNSGDELFSVIPDEVLLKENLNIGEALSEIELKNKFKDLAERNVPFNKKNFFIGEVAYNHYIPSIVSHLARQSQFYTSYTPYQPELSQGTLTAIYEFQSYIVNLTGMDVSNASLYDGATAASEAMLMLCNHTNKDKVLVSSLLHPNVLDVLKTYASVSDIEIIEVANSDGSISCSDLEEKLSNDIACFMNQSPNVFGIIEDVSAISKIVSKKNISLVNVILEALSLGIINPPGGEGASVVCGEAQSFGNEISFGGPGLGFIAAKKEFIRKLPGRIVGKTIDLDGKTSYVLTLRAREQDIRREKATSNICTNNSLCALKATIYLSTLGEEGLREVAEQNVQKSHYAFSELSKIGKINIPYKKPFFNEFLIELPEDTDIVREKLYNRGIYVSTSHLEKYHPTLKNPLILSFTELSSKEEIDYLVKTLKEVL